MFESLDKQIAADEKRMMSMRERVWIWMSIVLFSVLVFSGLYLALRLLA